jgi:hypothetical protein
MKQKKAAKRKGGKRKDRNTKGTSHSGMANTPTFQNFIYSIYSEKREITQKCRPRKTRIFGPKYIISCRRGQAKYPFVTESFHSFIP